jgi:hypothetical protein
VRELFIITIVSSSRRWCRYILVHLQNISAVCVDIIYIIDVYLWMNVRAQLCEIILRGFILLAHSLDRGSSSLPKTIGQVKTLHSSQG